MKIELRPWREVWPNIATTLFVAVVAFIGIAEIIEWLPTIQSATQSVADCPIHITTSSQYGTPLYGYCLHIGVGR